MFFAHFAAADLCTKQGITELFCAREVHGCGEDGYLCARINCCEAFHIMGPNWARVALAYGVVVYGGSYILGRLRNLSNCIKWIEIFDTCARRNTPTSRPFLGFFAEKDFRQIIGPDAFEQIVLSLTVVGAEVFLPREPFCFGRSKIEKSCQNHQNRIEIHDLQYNNCQLALENSIFLHSQIFKKFKISF